jgi:hypothetical protein
MSSKKNSKKPAYLKAPSKGRPLRDLPIAHLDPYLYKGNIHPSNTKESMFDFLCWMYVIFKTNLARQPFVTVDPNFVFEFENTDKSEWRTSVKISHHHVFFYCSNQKDRESLETHLETDNFDVVIKLFLMYQLLPKDLNRINRLLGVTDEPMNRSRYIERDIYESNIKFIQTVCTHQRALFDFYENEYTIVRDKFPVKLRKTPDFSFLEKTFFRQLQLFPLVKKTKLHHWIDKSNLSAS